MNEGIKNKIKGQIERKQKEMKGMEKEMKNEKEIKGQKNEKKDEGLEGE